MRLEADIYESALRAPVSASHGPTESRELVLVTVTAPGGVAGHGEAAPLASYDGVSPRDVMAALADCRDVIEAWDGAPETRAATLAECRRRAVLPHAVAALDLAMWDLIGRRLSEPVWRLLGAARADPIELNATIAAADRAGAAGEAAAARKAGFGTLKLKVGLGDDAGRVAAVRAAAGPGMHIRLDANGAWSARAALDNLRALAPAGIELCEEPVHGLEEFDALAELAAGAPPTQLALDESAVLPGALERAYGDAACLKIASSGGITGLLERTSRARAAGYDVYLASTLDGPIGISAALHAAAVIAPDRACGLATLPLFRAAVPPGLDAAAGRLAPPPGPGLGDGLVDWYQ